MKKRRRVSCRGNYNLACWNDNANDDVPVFETPNVENTSKQLLHFSLQEDPATSSQFFKHSLRLDPAADFLGRHTASTWLSASHPVAWTSIKLESLRKLSVGLWVPELSGVVLVQSRGTILHRTVNRFVKKVSETESVVCLHPEEALFCMERGSLVVFCGNTGHLISVEEFYHILMLSACSKTSDVQDSCPWQLPLSVYVAYVCLRQKGLQLKRVTAVPRIAQTSSQLAVETARWDSLFDVMRHVFRSCISAPSLLQPARDRPLELECGAEERTSTSKTARAVSDDKSLVYERKPTTFLCAATSIPARGARIWNVRLEKAVGSSDSQQELSGMGNKRASKALFKAYCLLPFSVVDPDSVALDALYAQRIPQTDYPQSMTVCSEPTGASHLFAVSSGTASAVYLLASPLESVS